MADNFNSAEFKLHETDKGVMINQIGYNPRDYKRAIIKGRAHAVYLVDENGNYVWNGIPRYYGLDKVSGDEVSTIDFSGFTKKGKYHFVCEAGESLEFEVKEGLHESAFNALLKSYYYQRCGCELRREFAGKFIHPACHTKPSRLWEDESVEKLVVGGWHDAGDYGRYVTAGATAVAHLLYAYKLFDKSFNKVDLNIPEKGTMGRSFIEEIRYELKWMLQMQREDGAVYHKQTTKEHAFFVMPEHDSGQMYIFPVSSVATADFAAVCALASQVFVRFDNAFAIELEKAAEKAYAWLTKNPKFTEFKNPEGCTTGEYGENGDQDNRLWAAVELYNKTGEAGYLADVKYFLLGEINTVALGYAQVGGLAALGWLCEHHEEYNDITNRFRSDFTARADALLLKCNEGGYGVSLREHDFHWGSNMFMITNACQMAIAAQFNNTYKYDQAIYHHIDYMVGVNPLGISYVTGVGTNYVKNPHLRTAFADRVDDVIPGYVVGGPNKEPVEWQLEGKFKDIPPMKCYIDDVRFYSLNEVTIYWNSPMIFLIAYVESKHFLN
ncbi:MAG: glycoside hydrolase family 9 protein [Lachnospiraceae bacterium]|nr:glycoside hydrolase family 9 protein [Lachnospiraceae bacterium]